MGNIANKRGGMGGRNAPPQTYTAFGDIDHGPNADPIGALVQGVLFLLGLSILGFVLWCMDRLTGKQ